MNTVKKMDASSEEIITPDKGFKAKAFYLIKYHFHFILLSYVYFGLVLCGLLAPKDRVLELGSSIVTEGWHFSLLASVFMLPLLSYYLYRFLLSNK